MSCLVPSLEFPKSPWLKLGSKLPFEFVHGNKRQTKLNIHLSIYIWYKTLIGLMAELWTIRNLSEKNFDTALLFTLVGFVCNLTVGYWMNFVLQLCKGFKIRW